MTRGGEAPHTFVLRFGMLFFEVLDGDRMILWFDSGAGSRRTLSLLQLGNRLRVGKTTAGRRKLLQRIA